MINKQSSRLKQWAMNMNRLAVSSLKILSLFDFSLFTLELELQGQG